MAMLQEGEMNISKVLTGMIVALALGGCATVTPVSGQFPSEWDVQFALLGDIIRDGGQLLADLLSDRHAHDAAFHP